MSGPMNMEPEYKPRKWRVLGTTPVRRDGIDKVTGQAKFGDDIHLPDMLHGKVVRSPHPHARIKRIDTSKALAVPGVTVSARFASAGIGFSPLRMLRNDSMTQDSRSTLKVMSMGV